MANDIDSLSIQISASSKSASKKLEELIGNINNLQGALGKLDTTSIDHLAASTQVLSEAMGSLKGVKTSSLKNVVTALSSISTTTAPIRDAAKAVNELSESASNVEKPLSGMANSVDNVGSVKEKVDALVSKFKEFEEPLKSSMISLTKFGNLMQRFKIISPTSDFKKVNKDIEETKKKYVALYAKIDALMKRRANGDSSVKDSSIDTEMVKLEGLRNEYDALLLKQKELALEGGAVKFDSKNFDILKSTLSDVGHNFTSIIGKLGKFALAFSGIPRMAKKAKEAISKFSLSNIHLVESLERTIKMLRLMVVRMALRAVIDDVSQGFQNLIQYSDKFDASGSLLWNSMRQLGNAIAAMVSPLINALAPALNSLIQLLIKAVDWVNQLFSALTGSNTWTRAKTLTDDYRTSLDKTGKSAKKLNKQLQGFDALNNLTTSEQNTSGGTSPADMFEDVKVPQSMKDLAKWLKDMWDNADFYDLGKKLGEKLKNWLDAIPWNKIKDTSRKLGKSIATLINGFVEVEGLGYSIGKTFAEGINTVFEGLNSLVHELHWDSIGKFIAETFNGFFENIDWPLIKDTVITGIKGLASAINSFIDTFNWDNISETISNLVNIISEGIYTFFTETDFEKLGHKLGEQLRKTIEKIDWKMLGKAIGSILRNAIDFVKAFFSEQDFGEIVKAVKDFFSGLFEEINVGELAGIIGGSLGLSLLGALPKLFATIIRNKIGASILKKVFEEASTSGASESVASGVGKALTDASTSSTVTSASAVLGSAITIGIGSVIGAKLGEVMANAIGNITNDETFKNFKLMGEGGFFDTVFGDLSIADSVSEKLKMISDGGKDIISAWDELKKDKDGSPTTIIAQIAQVAVETTNPVIGLRDNLVNAASGIKEGWQALVDFLPKVSEGFGELGDNLKQFIDEKIKPAFDKEKWTFDGIGEGLKESFNKAIDKIKTKWNEFANKWNEKLKLDIPPIVVAGKQITEGVNFDLGKIPTFATGGFPENGLFMANSTELVGKFDNGKTAVANNEQIIQGISQGVSTAMSEQNQILLEQNNLLQQLLEKEFGISKGDLFRSVQSSASDYQKRTGRYAFSN